MPASGNATSTHTKDGKSSCTSQWGTTTSTEGRTTCELASFPAPRPEQQALFAALAGDQAETDRFLGVLTGAVPMEQYFTPRNLVRLIGLRGLGRMLLGRRGRARTGARQPVRA